MNDIHNQCDAVIGEVTEGVRQFTLDNGSINADQAVAQIIMDQLHDWMDDECLTGVSKERLVRMANHMGPDWAQALYHAAVFITKVA